MLVYYGNIQCILHASIDKGISQVCYDNWVKWRIRLWRGGGVWKLGWSLIVATIAGTGEGRQPEEREAFAWIYQICVDRCSSLFLDWVHSSAKSKTNLRKYAVNASVLNIVSSFIKKQ